MLKSFHRFTRFTKVDCNVIILGHYRDYCDNMNFRKQKYDQKFSVNKTNVNEYRKWTPVAPQPKELGHYFSVLNYNILSQQLLEDHTYLYQNHSNNALSWNQRFYNLVGEIKHNNPDILCCQEVQESHLADIQARLRSLNYDVVYKKRTGAKPDGCAIFYKRSLFNIIEHHKIEFEQPGVKLLDRENVAVVCKFELKNDPKVCFVVATTHLLYNPRRQDIRLAQVQILLAEIDRIAKIPITSENGENHHLPIILTGDFNLKPYSAPYNLIVNGMLHYENLTQKTLSSGANNANNPTNGRLLLPVKLGITDECRHVQNEIKLYHSENNRIQNDHDIEITKEIVNLFQTGCLKHYFNFQSAYPQPENFVSTYHDKWILVDYMFYTSGSHNETTNSPELKLVSYLTLPTREQCDSIKLRIPNSYLGSDHLMLHARFFIASNTSSSTKL